MRCDRLAIWQSDFRNRCIGILSFFCAHKIAFLFSAKFDRIFWRTPVTVVMVDMRDMHASTENITKKKNDKLVDTQRTAQHITADGRLHGAQRHTEREREKKRLIHGTSFSS